MTDTSRMALPDLLCRITFPGLVTACFADCTCKILSTQGKLVSVLRGRVLDVAVDVRVGSPNFGRHVAVELSEENRRQLWVPRGFAHGFAVLSETADFFYKCDNPYSPKDEIVVRWDDPGHRHRVGHRATIAGATRCRGAEIGRYHKFAGLRTSLMRILLTGTSGQVGGLCVRCLRVRTIF